MRHETGNDFDRTERTDARTTGLARLSELDDYKVADGDPDIRGWDVKTPDGQRLGKVEDLIADPAARRVRYMEVKLDETSSGDRNEQLVLLPIGTARLNDDNDDVIINRLPTGGFSNVPGYSGDRITRDYETALCSVYGTADSRPSASGDFYDRDLYDDRSFYGDRRQQR